MLNADLRVSYIYSQLVSFFSLCLMLQTARFAYTLDPSLQLHEFRHFTQPFLIRSSRVFITKNINFHVCSTVRLRRFEFYSNFFLASIFNPIRRGYGKYNFQLNSSHCQMEVRLSYLYFNASNASCISCYVEEPVREGPKLETNIAVCSTENKSWKGNRLQT